MSFCGNTYYCARLTILIKVCWLIDRAIDPGGWVRHMGQSKRKEREIEWPIFDYKVHVKTWKAFSMQFLLEITEPSREYYKIFSCKSSCLSLIVNRSWESCIIWDKKTLEQLYLQLLHLQDGHVLFLHFSLLYQLGCRVISGFGGHNFLDKQSSSSRKVAFFWFRWLEVKETRCLMWFWTVFGREGKKKSRGKLHSWVNESATPNYGSRFHDSISFHILPLGQKDGLKGCSYKNFLITS